MTVYSHFHLELPKCKFDQYDNNWHFHGLLFCLQVQDKFRLDLSDEEAVHYMQSLIDESVGALFAAVVEQIHKFAQVSLLKHTT